MSDRFKFRAWDKENNYMMMFDKHKHGLLFASGGFCVSSGYDSYDQPTFDDENADDYIIMQCTGLRDKNGKLVFDKDFIKLRSGEVCLVWYSENDFTFLVEVKTHNIGLTNLCFLKGYRDFEVIGSEHENPELVK